VEQEDLGALFARITRRLVEAERPLLEAHGLSMWGYIALSHLAREPADTQLALARAIRHDKTRLIALLDELEGQDLITRTADPNDRRARIVRLTAAGAALHAAARADIRAMEEEFLASLDPSERTGLRGMLAQLRATSEAPARGA
jgi:DNA-binding MarR family transcriptional regulator